MPASTFTISRKDWREALIAVLAHAGVDGTLPIIAAVHIDWDGTGLTFVSTDRYTLGVYRHDFPTDADRPDVAPFAFLMPRAVAADSVKLFPPKRGRILSPSMRVTVEDGRLTIHDDLTEPDLTLASRGIDGEYPKWRSIITGIRAKDRGLTDGIALNPHYLARWSQASSLNDSVRVLAHGPTGALLVSVGPNFFGVQMPVRLTEHDSPALFDEDRWKPILDAVAKKPAKKKASAA